MTDTPIDRDKLRAEANSYRVYGADWFADQIEVLLAALDEAEAKLKTVLRREAEAYSRHEARAEQAAREARATALQEAANVCTGDEDRPEMPSGAQLRRMSAHEQFAHEQKRLAWLDADAILALLDTPAAEALERVRALEREACAKVAETEDAEMQKVADFYRPPRIDCDPYLADLHEQGAIVAARIAAAIRARGET